jgi:tetratricopeptide (TPR) repeat protein
MGPIPPQESWWSPMVPTPEPIVRTVPHAPAAARAFVRSLGGLALAALVLVVPATSHAQTAADAQRALEVTQAVIERATAATGCAPGETRLACSYLAQSVSLQQSARASYQGGFYRDAIALTLRARDRAYSALRIAQDVTGGEFVRLSIERTDALLERVSAIVRESGSEPARRTLDIASELQRKARGLAEAGRPRAALSATQQARDRAFQALRLADGGVRATPDRARGVLERTDDLLRASAWLGDVEGARPAFEKARSIQDRAWNRYRSGDAGRAMNLSLDARDQLGRALERADRTGPPAGGR